MKFISTQLASPSKKLFIAYIIVLHAAIIVMLLKSDFIERTAHYFGKQTQELTAYYHTTVSHHRRQDSQLPKDSVIFIGDSHIQGLATTNVIEPSINYGIGLDTTVGVLKRAGLYKSINNAKAVVIHIGVNDLKRRDNQTIISNMQTIIDSIKTSTPLIISSLLPVDERTARPHFSNQRINAINSELEKLTRVSGQLVLLKPPTTLLDSNGQLSAQYHNGDGLHLNGDGYRLWAIAIRESLERTPFD